MLETRLERAFERWLERRLDDVGEAVWRDDVGEPVRQFGQVVEMVFGQAVEEQMAMLGPRYNRSNLLEAEK